MSAGVSATALQPVAPQAVRDAPQPCVSVLMIAYNVEAYIEQALESILMQQVGFTYEIVVGEDRSTDRTREILAGYARRHAGRIRLILRERNLGMNPNFFATFRECRGRYIALLDGDDYWTSPLKLQKQVDFLEANPDCAICFHNVRVEYENQPQAAHPFHVEAPRHRISARVPRPRTGLQELARGNYLQTGSVMYRGGVVRELPDWVERMPTFDWPLHVLHAEHGRIGYLDEVLGAYRVHDRGFWSTNLSHYRTVAEVEHMLAAYARLERHLGGRYRASMAPPRAYLYQRAMKLAGAADDHRLAGRYAERYLRSHALHDRRATRQALGLALRGRAPLLHRAARSLKAMIRGAAPASRRAPVDTRAADEAAS